MDTPVQPCFTHYSVREEIAKYDRLKKNYEDPTYEVVSGIFRALSKKKIIGASNFQRYVSLLEPSTQAHLAHISCQTSSVRVTRR